MPIALELPFNYSIRALKKRAKNESIINVVDFDPVLLNEFQATDLQIVLQVEGKYENFDILKLPDGRLIPTIGQCDLDIEGIRQVCDDIRSSIRLGVRPRHNPLTDRLLPETSSRNEEILKENIPEDIRKILWSNEDSKRIRFQKEVADQAIILDRKLVFIGLEPVWDVTFTRGFRPEASIHLRDASKTYGRSFRIDRIQQAIAYAEMGSKNASQIKNDIPKIIDHGNHEWSFDEEAALLKHLKLYITALWGSNGQRAYLPLQPAHFFIAYCGIRDAENLDDAIPHLYALREALNGPPAIDEFRKNFFPHLDLMLWSIEEQRIPTIEMEALSSLSL